MWVPFTDTVVIVTSNPTTKSVLVPVPESAPVTVAAGKYILIGYVYMRRQHFFFIPPLIFFIPSLLSFILTTPFFPFFS